MLVQVPLPLVEVWEDLQPRVEQRSGEAGMQILRAILEDEVTRREAPRTVRGRSRVPCAGGGSRVT